MQTHIEGFKHSTEEETKYTQYVVFVWAWSLIPDVKVRLDIIKSLTGQFDSLLSNMLYLAIKPADL